MGSQADGRPTSPRQIIRAHEIHLPQGAPEQPEQRCAPCTMTSASPANTASGNRSPNLRSPWPCTRGAAKKATGPDQISFEALRAMTQDPHWSKRILQMVNDCFYKASFPEELLTGATILLPKVAIPSEWGQTRSITLSSAVLKWCSQVLLLRGQIYLAPCNRLQFSAPGKQKTGPGGPRMVRAAVHSQNRYRQSV